MLRCYLLYILLLLSLAGFAQPNFQRLTVEDGLFNNIVFGVVQDNKNFMWFATMSGVDRFDGKSIVHYRLSEDKTEGNYEFRQVINVLKDKNGEIWASTSTQLYKYDRISDQFTFVLNYGPASTSAITVFSDKHSHIWIGTNNSLLRYNITSKKLTQISSEKNATKSWAFTEDYNGNIWVASGIGVQQYLYNTHLNTFKKINFPLNIKIKLDAAALLFDKKKALWIGTQENGLYIIDTKTKQRVNTSTINKLVKNTAIRSIVYLPKANQYLLGTDGDGLITLSEELDIISHDTYNSDKPSSLSGNGIYKIYNDKFDRLWITTFGGGVSYTLDKLPFKNFVHEINNANSLYNNMGRSCAQDDDGRLWFGTSKGISIYNPATKLWRYLSLGTQDRPNDGANVLSLLNTGDGFIWAGTYGNGLKKINTKTGKIDHYSIGDGKTLQTSLSTNYIFSLYQDVRKNIWIGGIRGSICVLNPQLSVITTYPVRDVHAIIENKNGDILAGGTNGISLINTHTNAVSKITLSPEYQSMQVFSMYRQPDETIWLGTRGTGLLLYKPGKGIVKHYMETNGLPSAMVYGILPDGQQRLWISTSNGLSCLTPRTESFQNYSRADGLGTSQFNGGASYKTSGGELVFGGTNGFVLFNPLDIKHKSYPSRITFTDFRIANQSVIAGTENAPIQKQIDDIAEIYLKHNQNSISFNFVNISPQSADKNSYSWKLEGFDKSWSPPSPAGTANYTNLDPGSYTFKVKTLNNSYNNQRSINIIISRPFYASWWAFLIYIVVVALLFIGLKSYAQNWLARKRYKERLQFFINIAHDLRTPLTLIKSPISSILDKPGISPEDKKSLVIAERNADRLTRLVTQLMDFQKADLNKMVIQADRYNIVSALQDILKSFKPLFDEKKIVLDFKCDLDELMIWLDADKFEKIIYNVISNAIKYSKTGGTVRVALEKEETQCIIKVADDGIGIPYKQQKHIFSGYYRAYNTANLQETGSGIGLMLTKQLIELHKGQISFSSTQNVGTEFKLSFLLKDHFSTEQKLNDYKKTDEINQETNEDSRKKERILITEDNKDLRAYLINELSNFYIADEAENGKEALKLTKQHSYSLIISDVMMPELNGYELCSTLKNQISTCHIPIILLTAIHDEDYRLEGYNVGADDYVQKPFNIQHLIKRIDNLLKNRAIIKNKFFNVVEKPNFDVNEDPNSVFLNKATQIVTKNIQNPSFSIDNLCSELAISRPVLFRRLKSIADVAPQDFIKNIRLKIAAELLMSKKYSISEISFLTGFSDPKYFSTSFKKKFGQSPSEYLRDVNR